MKKRHGKLDAVCITGGEPLVSLDLEFVKKQSLDFCKNQKLRQAIMDAVELLDTSDYDGIKYNIDQALKAGIRKDLGHNYKEGVKARYEEEARKCVKTDWAVLNDLMDD